MSKHLGEEFAVGTTLVQVVLARPHVVQARGHAPHGGGPTLDQERRLGELLIDADVHVGVDQAGKAEHAIGVDHFGAVDRQLEADGGHLAVTYGDVDRRHLGLPVVLAPLRGDGTHQANILDDSVEGFVSHSQVIL